MTSFYFVFLHRWFNKGKINSLSSLKLTIRKLNVQKRVEILIILTFSFYHITKKSSFVLLSLLFMYSCT